MRSESEAFKAMYRERDDARVALLDARRQLAALRTERKMQEARKRQIERYERDARQLHDRIAAWRDGHNADMAMAAGQVRRLMSERNEARAQAESAAIELNQLRQEVTTLRGEVASLRAKQVVTAPPTTVQLGGHRMDADGGPVCRCGKPSTHESGWCGACGVVSSPASDPFAAIKSDVESLWAVLSRHADAIAELRGKAGDRG